jgi:hypothetical protein
VKNLVNRQYLLFPQTGRHSKFGSVLCKIRGEKHNTTFVKVVEGSEIYNFPIHHFVHLYSTFWRFTCSNRHAVTQFGRPALRSPRCQGHLAPSRGHFFRGWEHSEVSEVRAPATWSPCPRRHPRTVLSTGPPRGSLRAPVEVARRTVS